MGKLGDILGDDFEEEYESKREQRREQARKVEKETLMEICFQAIEGGGFDGEEPRFRFDAGEIDHDVLLMESPEDDLNRFQWDLGDDAKTQGMFHLNQLFSCAFQENMLHLLEKVETDEYYVVVGRYQEKTQEDSDGNSETYYNINPVRGIVPLELAKQYADQYEEQMEGTSIEEQAQKQQEQAEEDDEPSADEDTSSAEDGEGDSDVDLGGIGGDDDQVDRQRIIEVFQAIGSDAPQVLEAVANGDEDAMQKLVTVTNNNLDGEADRERILDIFEEEVEEIPGRGEEEEEEDDDIDLGGIGGDGEDEEDESDSEEAEEEPEPEPESETEDSSDDDGDGDGGVDDWF